MRKPGKYPTTTRGYPLALIIAAFTAGATVNATIVKLFIE